MFRPLLLAAALTASAALPATAQIRQGLYALEGQNPDGSTYSGLFALQEAPGASWVASWQVGDARLMGLGLIQGGVLAISFLANGRPGVAAFEVEADGRLRGSWTIGQGLGTEMLTPQ